MKKRFVVSLLLLFFSNILFGQTLKKDIIGNWIKFKAERKDGSKIIDRIGMDTAFLEYSFTAKDFSSQFHPFQRKEGWGYYIKNDPIYVDIFSEYQIEKITQDTLILSVVSQTEPDHKSNRYYFVRKDILAKKHPIKRKDDIPIYNKYNTPRVHKTFNKYLKTCNSNNTNTFRFKGSLTFDHKAESIAANLYFFDNVDKTRKSNLKHCLESTYLYWDFAGVPKYAKSKIYFVAKSIGNSSYIKFIFCTEDMLAVDHLKSINSKDLDKSKEYYLKGMADMENNLLDAAIDNFSLSYKFDAIRIDAIYKRAEAFLKKGDKDQACKDWDSLMNLGQQLAKKKYLENCK